MAHTIPTEEMIDGILIDPVEKDLTNGGANDINTVVWSGIPAGITEMELRFYALSYENFNEGLPVIDMLPGTGDGTGYSIAGRLSNDDISGLTVRTRTSQYSYDGKPPLTPNIPFGTWSEAYIDVHQFVGRANFQLVQEYVERLPSAPDISAVWMIETSMVAAGSDREMCGLWWATLTGELTGLVLTSHKRKSSTELFDIGDIGSWDAGTAVLYIDGNY